MDELYNPQGLLPFTDDEYQWVDGPALTKLPQKLNVVYPDGTRKPCYTVADALIHLVFYPEMVQA
jgi:hypothetical protein